MNGRGVFGHMIPRAQSKGYVCVRLWPSISRPICSIQCNGWLCIDGHASADRTTTAFTPDASHVGSGGHAPNLMQPSGLELGATAYHTVREGSRQGWSRQGGGTRCGRSSLPLCQLAPPIRHNHRSRSLTLLTVFGRRQRLHCSGLVRAMARALLPSAIVMK